MTSLRRWFAVLAAMVAPADVGLAAAGPGRLDESPARPGEWGFRPADGSESQTNPPAFVWRPQARAARYEIQVARDAAFRTDLYRAGGVELNCHCPPRTFAPGTWYWRFRAVGADGKPTAWSTPRRFVLTARSASLPMPAKKDLLGRIPRTHPRLFLRPEDLPRLRRLADGPLKALRDDLIARCDRLLRDPPPTAEPPKYPPDAPRKSERWREIWWGNRTYTIRVLNSAATLAFTRLISGRDDYGRLARRLLLAAAEWDPKGATGYRYNDEAGMPYNYYFARTYTFLHDMLTEPQRARCRAVMAVRGDEMYRHLCPGHIWRPYASHANRAWHFLGEVGIAFLGEIPQAEQWVWFAANVFFNVYPVWSDADGGWHEGVSYWSSYIGRFTWWADVMRAAMGIDAYRKPYFSRVGYYPMYLQPPGTVGGGFGDLCARRRSADNVALMAILAAQARNGHWQWYVDAHGRSRGHGNYATSLPYVTFIRGALPKVAPRRPDDLPTSRVFRGTGLAMLNTNLADAADNVQVLFKSSPFGTQSHGYESNNSFLLYAFGERLFVRTGRRDIYASEHHRRWMWQTKSTNCIAVGGVGQLAHSPAARGRILGFHTSAELDYVAGEAADAYPRGTVERFTRHILFLKPGLVVLFDRLRAPRPVACQWFLHAPTEMKLAGPNVSARTGRAAAEVTFLAPTGLKITQTNRFDPPPRPRIRLTEWHVTAETTRPAERVAFVTAIRPHRSSGKPGPAPTLKAVPNGYALLCPRPAGDAVVLLRTADAGTVRHGPAAVDADLAVFLPATDGSLRPRLTVRGAEVSAAPELPPPRR